MKLIELWNLAKLFLLLLFLPISCLGFPALSHVFTFLSNLRIWCNMPLKTNCPFAKEFFSWYPKDSSHNIPYFLFSCLTAGTSAWGRWLCTCWNRAKNAAHGASGWHPVWDAVGLQLAGSCPLYSFLVASRINPSRPALTSHLPSQTALWLEGNQTRLTPGWREKKSCIFMHIQDIVKRFAILLSFKNFNIFIDFLFFYFYDI